MNTTTTAPTLDEFLVLYRKLPETHQTAVLALIQSAERIPLADLDRLTADVIAAPFEKRPGVITGFLLTGYTAPDAQRLADDFGVDPDACYQREDGFSYEEIAAWGAR